MMNHPMRHWLAASGMAVSALFAVPAQAGPYSNMFVFGDSVSDTGNVAAVFLANSWPMEPSPPNPFHVPDAPYAATNVFSNGPVWPTTLAGALGVSATPSLLGGTNFAYGAAQTNVPGPGPGGFPFSLSTQVDQLLTATGGVLPASALYVVESGAINARRALESLGPAPTLPQIVSTFSATANAYAIDTGNIIDRLQSAGAQHIVVWNTPNLAITPVVLAQEALFPGSAALAQLLVTTMNSALDYRLQGEAGTGVIKFDIYGLLNDAVANPINYGLTNVTLGCGAFVNACGSALFYDGIHPTSFAHSFVSNAMFATVVPEPASYAMFALGLAGLLVWGRRRLLVGGSPVQDLG